VSWQFAALGSITVPGLGTALAISIGRANMVTYVIEVEAPSQVATTTSAPQLERSKPTQTVFSPDYPESNMSSLSIDLVTLRERWLAVYDYSYVDEREPEASNDYE
jgi:type IV secretory pathway TrbF-like protein